MLGGQVHPLTLSLIWGLKLIINSADTGIVDGAMRRGGQWAARRGRVRARFSSARGEGGDAYSRQANGGMCGLPTSRRCRWYSLGAFEGGSHMITRGHGDLLHLRRHVRLAAGQAALLYSSKRPTE